MSEPVVLKAGIDAAVDAVCEVLKVVKEKKSALAEGADLVAALLGDADFKEKVSQVMAAGVSGLVSDAKSLDLESGLELAIAEVPAIISKVKAALA